ncbi:MAG: hypothetical protein ABJM43_00900 [Paracoccaceae bacterium]
MKGEWTLTLKISPPSLHRQRIGNHTISQRVKEIDAGRFLHLLFISDNFEQFEEGSFMALNASDADTELIGRCIDHTHEKLLTKTTKSWFCTS